MFYHTSAELGIEADKRIRATEERLILEESTAVSGGTMSFMDYIQLVQPKTDERIMKYINSLVGKETLISIPKIAVKLMIPEDVVTDTLQRNGLELICETDEEEDI